MFYALLYWPHSKEHKQLKFCRRLMFAGILNAVGILGLFFALLQVHPNVVGLMNRLGIVFAMLLSIAFMQLRPKRAEVVLGAMALIGAAGAVGAEFFSAQFSGVSMALVSMMTFTGSQFFLRGFCFGPIR